MSKYIDADALMQQRPENLNPTYIDHDIAQYNRGWNACNELWVSLIKELPAADVERWTSVDERLPEHEGSYLVCTAKSKTFISHYYPQYKHFNGANGHITHWMDRPEPPKMDGGSEE